MSDDYGDYVGFRAKLARKPKAFESRRLAGKSLQQGVWTEFQPSELLQRRLGAKRLSVALTDDLLAVEGRVATGEWRPLSTWLREAVSRAELVKELTVPAEGVPGSLDKVVRDMKATLAERGGSRIGAGEVVAHLELHVPAFYGVPLSRSATVQALKSLDFDVVRANIPGLLRNGRQRAQRFGCRFCEGKQERAGKSIGR